MKMERCILVFAKRADRRFDFRVPRVVAARGVNGAGPGLVEKFGQHFRGWASPQDESAAIRLQGRIERLQAAMKPPA